MFTSFYVCLCVSFVFLLYRALPERIKWNGMELSVPIKGLRFGRYEFIK